MWYVEILKNRCNTVGRTFCDAIQIGYFPVGEHVHSDTGKELTDYLANNLAGAYLLDEPLSRHTSYCIGGAADFFVAPHDPEILVDLLLKCSSLNINYFLLGGGANILANDDGYRGVIIILENLYCELTHNGETQVHAGAGVALKDLVLFCENNGLAGLSSLAGVPGTVGGALRMNAGTKQGEIGDCVTDILCLDTTTFQAHRLHKGEITFNYRSVPQLQNKIIIGCDFELEQSSKGQLKNDRLRQLSERAAKQPLAFPSCGSVFKRPPGHFVGAMVEELGLKGKMHGDAVISEKHAGFILNMGCAKASDILWLINHIQELVLKNYNVELETEVQMLGF